MEVHALYTLVRSTQGEITAAMRGGEPLPVPAGKCRAIFRDRVSSAEACSADLVAVPDLWSATSPLARLEDDLLVGGLPAVAAGPGDSPAIAVGESLLLEPLDPVIEDRTDADAFAGIDIDPLADLDFGAGEIGTDPDPLGNLNFGAGRSARTSPRRRRGSSRRPRISADGPGPVRRRFEAAETGKELVELGPEFRGQVGEVHAPVGELPVGAVGFAQ